MFIRYLNARKILAHRLKATPDEIAVWIWMGRLKAYIGVGELDPPPRFNYDLGDGGDFDYLSPLMALWFRENDIINFQPKPADRFITGKALIERWREQAENQPEAFIWAKIAESRLLDAHPIFGTTQGFFSDGASNPPLESCLFTLFHVEKIEEEDFGERDVKKVRAILKISPRDKALQDDANALAKKWIGKNRIIFSEREIAEELATSNKWKQMTAARIERIIRKGW